MEEMYGWFMRFKEARKKIYDKTNKTKSKLYTTIIVDKCSINNNFRFYVLLYFIK